MGEEHVKSIVDEAIPPIAAGIVRDLLVDEAGHDRGVEVEIGGMRYYAVAARDNVSGRLGRRSSPSTDGA